MLFCGSVGRVENTCVRSPLGEWLREFCEIVAKELRCTELLRRAEEALHCSRFVLENYRRTLHKDRTACNQPPGDIKSKRLLKFGTHGKKGNRCCMREPRIFRRCYLQCSDCHIFVLFDTHSNGVATRPGLCPACRSTLKLKQFWKVGYVSQKECKARSTSQQPLDSAEDVISLQPPHAA